MTGFRQISTQQLWRLIATPSCPDVIDVQTGEDFGAAPRLIPTAVRRSHTDIAHWADGLAGRRAVVVCQRGRKLSEGVAALLRRAGADASTLEGGALGWLEAGLPTVPFDRLRIDAESGSTTWVTRARPKIDRVACAWLLRRFVDREACVLFVRPAEVHGVAERFAGTAFDVEGAEFCDRDGRCTFDALLAHFELADVAPLARLASIVRAADLGALNAVPEAAGVLAASLGLSRMYTSDEAQVDAGMLLYDALYRWCRDATDEVHDASSHVRRSAARG